MSTYFFMSHAFCLPKPPFVHLFYYSLLFPCFITIVTCQLWEINPTYANNIAFYNDVNRFDFPLDIKFPCIFNSVGNKTSCSSEELDIYSQPYLHRNSTAPAVYAGSYSVNQQMIWINFSGIIMLLDTNMSLRYDMFSNFSDYVSFIKEDRERSINLCVVSSPASSLRNLHVFESYIMNLSHFRLRKAYSGQMFAQSFAGRPIYLLHEDKPKLTDSFRYSEILASEPDAAVLLGSPQQQYSQRSDTSKTSEEAMVKVGAALPESPQQQYSQESDTSKTSKKTMVKVGAALPESPQQQYSQESDTRKTSKKTIVKVGAILGFFVLITGVSLCLVIQLKNQKQGNTKH